MSVTLWRQSLDQWNICEYIHACYQTYDQLLNSQHSTRIAIKMSRATEKTKDGGDGKVSQSVVSDDEEEDEFIDVDVDDDDREETPDLYRNSALGM